MADVGGLSAHIHELKSRAAESFNTIDGPALQKEKDDLTALMAAADFWSDQKSAAEKSQRHAKLEMRLKPWEELLKNLDDMAELAELSDESMAEEITAAYKEAEKTYTALKEELKLAGEYDDFDAIISIHAGAGGTDAQDWAEILERMYLRWCEQNHFKVEAIDRSAGDEAGIKSTSFYVSGPFAYGKLKSEHGVHRLVRLSPFNADSLRQTSFAKLEVTPKIDSPDDMKLDEKDLKIDVYRSGGKGGQSVNTTDSAVRVTHLPTGIVVAIQNERSQLQNKETALTILRSKLAQLQRDQHTESLKELKGPNEQAAWGNQIRNYVLHPYKMVKDTRTGHETVDVDGVLAGDINGFMNAFLDATLGK